MTAALFTLVDIIDAIANDLAPIARAASPGVVGAYTDWRYVEPDSLNPEHAPWLAVYSPSTVHTLISTTTDPGDGEFMDEIEISIEWAVSLASEVEQGGAGNPALVRAAILQAQPIIDQLRSYSAGLPEPFDNQVLGTLARSSREEARGIVFRQAWTLTVNSLGAR